VSSPFQKLPPSSWVAHNDYAFAIADGFPVSPGHTLVVTKRLVATWFDATPTEQLALIDLVGVVKRLLDANHHPDGYNVGWNAGAAAGQTVPHLHVHVIPRYHGDVADPRGGVRHVVPGKGNYLATWQPADADDVQPRRSALAEGGSDDAFLAHLEPLLARANDIAVLAAFVQHAGVELLAPYLLAAVDRGARVRLLTGDYLHITQRAALEALLGWTARESAGGPGRLPEVRIVQTAGLATLAKSFHPKAWLVRGSGFATAWVGSSNVSRAALLDGIEWNLRIDEARDAGAFLRVAAAWESWWLRGTVLDGAFLRGYRTRLLVSIQHAAPPEEFVPEAANPPPAPHSLQKAALADLAQARLASRRRALVVLATGLGKTWLAAFDAAALGRDLGRSPRVLFVAHREELLRQAEAVFHRQFPNATRGYFAGAADDLDADQVFASVLKLARPEHLRRLEGQPFDYAVIDEAHHAEARGYRRVLDHLRAEFVLGLTATPDRADQADVRALFDGHVAFEAGISDGIEAGRLVPFDYLGLPDTIDYRPIPWRNGRFDPAELEARAADELRMQRAWNALQRHPGRRTLVFCCSVRHANLVAAWLGAHGLRAVAVHTGEGSADRRTALSALERGELDAVCAVDLFNEGIDVPVLDRVLMLRPSESPVVFLQQLGRGLRVAADKARLTVLDFVGNHRVFLDRLRILAAAIGLDQRQPLAAWLEVAARTGSLQADNGCNVALELEAVDLLRALLPRTDRNEVVRVFREMRAAREHRPTAGELHGLGLRPRTASPDGWLAFVDAEAAFDADELAAYQAGRAFLRDLETTEMSKCFKMVTLQALIEADALASGLAVDELGARCHAILRRTPDLARDLPDDLLHGSPDSAAWRRYWRQNPVAAWIGESAKQPRRNWFRLDGDRFVPGFDVPFTVADALGTLVIELVEWRLAAYRQRQLPGQQRAFPCKVTWNQRDPILKLPDRARVAGVPDDDTEVTLPDGRRWTFGFRAQFVNIARDAPGGTNRLPELLREWFGAGAGRPGTSFQVRFVPHGGGWHVEPVALGDADLVPLPVRVRLPAFTSLRAAAGWRLEFHDASAIGPDAEIELPLRRSLPGLFALKASGTSMAGWRHAIQDGDWLVLLPLGDVGLDAVLGDIAVVARGEPEARTLHVKRVLRRDDNAIVLRSDNPDVPDMVAAPGDIAVARVVEVVRP